MTFTPWPHQVRAVEQTIAAIDAGERALCITSPTGGGKTRIVTDLIERFLARDWPSILYTNRIMLLEQLQLVAQRAGIEHGVRAAGFAEENHHQVQVASIQTEYARVYKRERWNRFPAKVVFVDEAHGQAGPNAQEIIAAHKADGAAIIGITATPIDLAHIYTKLITAGTNSELRACGALVRCQTYGPDEPDARRLKNKTKTGEYSVGAIRHAIMTPTVFARVLEHYHKLNPDGRPAILFGPCVKSSMWFAEQFVKAGITAAHIDGEVISYGETTGEGEDEEAVTVPTSREEREDILAGSRDGSIKVLCNRFVMREGIDAPWLAHGILATVFGGVGGYLQAGGRLLRSYPGKDHVVIQDHGGCLDSETEILTDRGWMVRTAIQDSDLVAGFCIRTGEISWQPILHRHDRPLEVGEQMFEVAGKCCDFRVTGNHRLVFKKRTCTPASEAVWPDHWKLDRTDGLSGSLVRMKIPVSGVQAAIGVPLTDDELRFIGWFVTDGTMAGKRQAVSISQSNHQPQINDLRKCLSGCGFDVREYVTIGGGGFSTSNSSTKFSIPKGTCAARPRNGWARLAPYLAKSLSPLLDNMTEAQFIVFLHAVHLGDGAKDRHRDSYKIFTGHRVFCDRLQSLCVRRGYRCNITIRHSSPKQKSDLYILNIKKMTALTIHGKQPVGGQVAIKVSPSIVGERVWCVANQLETLVVRRNGKVAVIGNSFWRHGSLNADRQWNMTWRNIDYSNEREASLRVDKSLEPIRCPRCNKIRAGGEQCRECGYTTSLKSRMVVQTNGELRELKGDIFKKKKTEHRSDTEKLWLQIFWSFRKAGKTFSQARGYFYQLHRYWPPETLPLMPRSEFDWKAKIANVPFTDLVPSSQPAPRTESKDAQGRFA